MTKDYEYFMREVKEELTRLGHKFEDVDFDWYADFNAESSQCDAVGAVDMALYLQGDK